MKRFFLAGLLLAFPLMVSAGQEDRFQVVQGYVYMTLPIEQGKDAPRMPVMIKIDSVTGDTWQLITPQGEFYWTPLKNKTTK